MEEHRVRMSENRVLRRILGATRDEGTSCWRRLHNEELRSSYSSQNISLVMKSEYMGRACGAHERALKLFSQF
jgi:hypothetical protein